MVSLFVKEQKRYTKKKLCELFVCSEEKIVHLLKRLKEFGVVKAVKASDSQKDMDELLEEDIAVSDVEIGVIQIVYRCLVQPVSIWCGKRYVLILWTTS